MIATLPMYDRPETAKANDRLWSNIAAGLIKGGIDAPLALTRGPDLWAYWQAPELILAQTCGLPYRAQLHGKVTLLGTADHCLPNCPPGHYNSVVVVRKGMDLSTALGGIWAVNDGLSQSGWAALVEFAADHDLPPRRPLITGGHQKSARAVADGRADLATIDALTWRMIQRFDAWSSALDVVAQTRPTPALPYITAAGRDPAPLRVALIRGLDQLSTWDRDLLGIHGFIPFEPDDFLALPIPPKPGDLPESSAN